MIFDMEMYDTFFLRVKWNTGPKYNQVRTGICFYHITVKLIHFGITLGSPTLSLVVASAYSSSRTEFVAGALVFTAAGVGHQ